VYRAPRGTQDLLPEVQAQWRHVTARAEALCKLYGYQRIETPVFEEAGLFQRSIGSTTDVVEKEMYTFPDRSGDEMTLRPEGTAPVCRAYVEHGMHTRPQPVRLYYFAPIFRYERPQKGRFRQHHQFGVEALGEADPVVDAEIIEMAWKLFSDLGLKDLALLVNSIGCPQCRPAYLEKVKEYYSPLSPRLCPDCQRRLAQNPLRLLDCKRTSCMPLGEEAPRSADHLCAECHDHFHRLMHYLEDFGLPYRINHRLVRGFDYYTKTVFEIQPPREGAQSTLAGGGRYDGLIQELGGSPTPAVGFAAGLERLILELEQQGIPLPPAPSAKVFIAYAGETAKLEAARLASELRRQGVPLLMATGDRSLKAQLKHAGALGIGHVVILGERELAAGVAVIRDMAAGEQKEVPLQDLPGALASL